MRKWIDLSDPTPDLATWWFSGRGRNSWTVFECKTGAMSVYARRNAADQSVIEIASVSSIAGFGASRALYRTFCADIPAIAENILNPELDSFLARWGWDHAYYDLGGTPTRVNKAFQKRFPTYAEAHSPYVAIVSSRA